MAITINMGSQPKRKANSAAASDRAKAAKAALSVPSQTSDSGSTAVGTQGTLGKIKNFAGKALGIASKFVPGLGGTIAGALSNMLNDPEWWQSVPGDAVTLNAPLRYTVLDSKQTHGAIELNQAKMRVAMGEIISATYTPGEDSASLGAASGVISPNNIMITQYLLPEVRKVVNAIPLQTAEAYRQVLRVNATVYALWRTFKKYDYLLKHGQTYMASYDDPTFPILQVSNAAFLQSTINRLEEYLRSNVRLPHTLCEYLAWRFGRIYKSTDSAKAALIMYNVLSMSTSIAEYQGFIDLLLSLNSKTQEWQQANADLYNAYFDHDLLVDIRDDTQFTYDRKEFALRTNCDLATQRNTQMDDSPDCVYIDSALDNPTAFMASTVSTVGRDAAGNLTVLFPVSNAMAYMPASTSEFPQDSTSAGIASIFGDGNPGFSQIGWYRIATPSNWIALRINTYTSITSAQGEPQAVLCSLVTMAEACKALDMYNKDMYFPFAVYAKGGSIPTKRTLIDLTSLSSDMGLVPGFVIGTEQVYAFANLVHMERKHSMSYSTAEKLVAKDTANFVDSLDVAATAAPKP